MGCLQGEFCAAGGREISSHVVRRQVTAQPGDGAGCDQARAGETGPTSQSGRVARDFSIDPWDLRGRGGHEPDRAGDFVAAGGGVVREEDPALVSSLVGWIYPGPARDLLDGPKS